ncbi:MAG: sugar transferase [Candidatus Margulisbacteria bacterium]|nr:sugar transferase [Candidatus Margulisiibacteriota bacterium]
MKYQSKNLILLMGDIGILYLSLYLALWLRYWERPEPSLWATHLWPFTLIFIGWLIIFYIFNLYNLHLAVNNFRYLKLVVQAMLTSAVLSLSFFYLMPQIEIAPKRNLLIFIFVFAALFYLWRLFFNWLIKAQLPKNNIAIIGYNNRVEEIIEELKQKPHLGYKISFIIDDQSKTEKHEIKGVPVFKKIAGLKDLIRQYKITTMVLTTDPHESAELRSLLFKLLPLKISFVNLPNFYENITGKIPIEAINQMWFLENLSESKKKFFDVFKRLYDIIFAFIILIITLPFWPLIALIIKLESKGPVFIKMKRLGKNNKQFKMYKFRSMREEGNARTATIENDPRITKFGAFIRKTRIDEIPQVINIIKGEMSWVGPRPERPELAEKLSEKISFLNERTLVKPGATGWDQISGEYHSPSTEDTLKKIQYDFFYIKNRSIYLDLSIVLKTISTIFSKSGR